MKPLTRATRGVLRDSTSKGALVLAVAGVLYFGGDIVEPPVVLPEYPSSLPRGGVSSNYYQDEILQRIERIKIEDEQLMLIIKSFLDAVD